MKKRNVVTAVTLVMLLLIATIASAQTKITSLPYTITRSGQYFVDSCLTSTGDGIIVNADDVTIDLNGNTLTGNGTGSGVKGPEIYKNLEIKNGTVKNFEYGVNAIGHSIRVIDVRALNNTQIGLFVDDLVGCVIRNCTVNNNNVGISGWICLIEGNVANYNTSVGISASLSQFIGNIAIGNNVGIAIGEGGVLKNNSAFYNTAQGFILGGHNLVDGNSAFGNGVNMTPCANCTFGVNSAP